MPAPTSLRGVRRHCACACACACVRACAYVRARARARACLCVVVFVCVLLVLVLVLVLVLLVLVLLLCSILKWYITFYLTYYWWRVEVGRTSLVSDDTFLSGSGNPENERTVMSHTYAWWPVTILPIMKGSAYTKINSNSVSQRNGPYHCGCQFQQPIFSREWIIFLSELLLTDIANIATAFHDEWIS